MRSGLESFNTEDKAREAEVDARLDRVRHAADNKELETNFDAALRLLEEVQNCRTDFVCFVFRRRNPYDGVQCTCMDNSRDLMIRCLDMLCGLDRMAGGAVVPRVP